jgi:hypothetical protein
MPVVVCSSFIYPGMKTFLPVDTRQMKDLLHVVTASRDPQQARKFIIVREYTDMRGFMMFVRQVMRENDDRQLMVEVVGQERVVLDSVFIPDERRGLYQNSNQSLKFCKGRVIHDASPFSKEYDKVKKDILCNP